MKPPETWPILYPVTEERWKRFLQDGDDKLFHNTVVNSCGGKFRLALHGGLDGASPDVKAVVAECAKCGFGFASFGPWMSDQIYAITPEREPRYKLVEVTAGKNRFTTLVPQP
jgi:hypothetical protein